MSVSEKYNFTPFLADVAFTQDNDGLDCAVFVVKAAFAFSDAGKLEILPREETIPILPVDQFDGAPEASALQYPSDIIHDKQGTDIIVNGHAYAHGRSTIDAGFRLGPVAKILRCFGTRRWEQGLGGHNISPPEPFYRLALSYELAFGGSGPDGSGGRLSFAQNPLGIGYVTDGAEGNLLPHIEYRDRLIGRPQERPPPAALGAIPRHWPQRQIYAGTYDEKWMTSRRPLLPLDFDRRFLNTVAADQVHVAGLQGNETFELYNTHPRVPTLSITLPRLSLTVTLRVCGKRYTLPLTMDTLIIEPDDSRLCMTFRCTYPIDGQHTLLKSVHFHSNVDNVRLG